MKIDETVARNIAELAQLDLPEASLAETVNNLSGILDFVEAMSEANPDGIAPMANPLDLTQRLRPDAVTETNQRDRFQAIAPETSDGLYLVPRVVE